MFVQGESSSDGVEGSGTCVKIHIVLLMCKDGTARSTSRNGLYAAISLTFSWKKQPSFLIETSKDHYIIGFDRVLKSPGNRRDSKDRSDAFAVWDLEFKDLKIHCEDRISLITALCLPLMAIESWFLSCCRKRYFTWLSHSLIVINTRGR